MKKVILALVLAMLLSPAATYAVNTQASIIQEKQYKKIDVNTVPKETLGKIKKSYGDYTIKEAYRADDGEYKFILTKDGTNLTATFTPAGDLIKIL